MYNITPYVCVTMYLRYAMIVKYSFHSLILYEIFIGRDGSISLSVYIRGGKPRNTYSIINSFTPDHELIDDSYSS